MPIRVRHDSSECVGIWNTIVWHVWHNYLPISHHSCHVTTRRAQDAPVYNNCNQLTLAWVVSLLHVPIFCHTPIKYKSDKLNTKGLMKQANLVNRLLDLSILISIRESPLSVVLSDLRLDWRQTQHNLYMYYYYHIIVAAYQSFDDDTINFF